MFPTRRQQYGKRTYQTLGKMLVLKRPEVAEELIHYCPAESNISSLRIIPDLLSRFCQLRSIHPEECLGKLDNYEKMRHRRLFVATLLHLYCQEVFQQPPDCPLLPRGLLSAITEAVQLKKSYMSKLVRQVLYEEKQYDEFRQEVTSLVAQLKPTTHGQIETGKN